MALNLQHFDTKIRKDLDVQETIKNSIAEYLFPNTEFALGMVYQEAATANDLREYQSKTLQFASGERMYFASQPVRELLYPNPSDGAAYGSLVFTPNRQFSEPKNLRLLIVDDSTGNNGGLLPPDPSDGAAYGSLVFTPNRQFSEPKNLRILIVDDSTGNNGGLLPPDVAKKLVGDCYGKISTKLAQQGCPPRYVQNGTCCK